jgi:hypothetical protein
MLKIGVDIGGVISKYPEQFRKLLGVLHYGAAGLVEVHVITDQHDKAKVMKSLADNGLGYLPEFRVHCASYDAHGELCKAVLCRELGIDVMIDDFPGYLATPGDPPVRLLVMPDPRLPYWAESWKTNREDGAFGRRHPAKNPEDVVK